MLQKHAGKNNKLFFNHIVPLKELHLTTTAIAVALHYTPRLPKPVVTFVTQHRV